MTYIYKRHNWRHFFRDCKITSGQRKLENGWRSSEVERRWSREQIRTGQGGTGQKKTGRSKRGRDRTGRVGTGRVGTGRDRIRLGRSLEDRTGNDLRLDYLLFLHY